MTDTTPSRGHDILSGVQPVFEIGALLLLAHSLAHVATMAIAGRRILLEIGLRRYDPARHRLYCRREGGGPALLLLHGLGGSWRYWRRGLDGVRDHHTVYLPDLLGFGRSPKPRSDYSLSVHVDALARLVDEATGPITVVGHSMGAIVALGLYARFPARVERLVLIGLPYFPSRELAEASLSTVALMNRLVIGRSRLAPALCYLKDLLALPIFAPLAGMPMDLYRDYWKHTWASFSRSLFNTLLASDVAGLFQSVDRSKIRLLHGRHDPIAPIQHIRSLVDRLPDLALRELRGGHHLYLMYPRLLNRLMTEAT
jgi:pimeloyl-ACP methyl ester carboxylesterase